MTYAISTKGHCGRKCSENIRIRAAAAARPALGDDWWAFLIGGPVVASTFVSGGDPTECLAQANANTASLDSRIASIAASWFPSGYYSPAQIRQVVGQILALITSASTQVGSAPTATSDGHDQIFQALDSLHQKGASSEDFIVAANAADAQGIKIIDAPGLKKWVLESMNACSNALVVAFVQNCALPELAAAIMAFQQVFDQVAAVVVAVVGVAIAAGAAVLHVAEALPDIITYGAYAAAAAAGVWLILELRKSQRKRR